MTTATLDTPAPATREPLLDKGLDAIRHATHLSHEAKRLKTLATDAIEGGLHTVRRAATTAARNAAEFTDDIAHEVKRKPFTAMAIVFASGMVMGMLAGWMSHRAARDRSC
ncbi:MAG: hypothetical protein A3F69_01100 [Acidobacteria bacterium RIFCSPLOWO2_12_FULL_66_10]|nr:MAG: hypothetical protein A3F69_01100 [Acidobacteria bacterium RIFCSPLOWO2_12_FULL_66_10]